MRNINKILLKGIVVLWLTLFAIGLVGIVNAQPFGKGKFGANVPFGSETSLAISTTGNVTIQITPTDAGVLGTATNNVTITSTDVVGYKLYIRALTTTNMVNGAATLPASANGTPAALAVNTWGYNTDASANFVGITASDVLLKTATGPFSSGDLTQLTYGVKIDNNKPAGNYVTTVIYTAAPQTD